MAEEDVVPYQDPFQRDQQFTDSLTDQIPQEGQESRSSIDDIPDDDLSTYIMQKLRNDISDKEEMSWKKKRQYDINSYYGIKMPLNYPWNNASNFAVPLTSTLLDTAHSNLHGSIYFDVHDTIDVEGIGPEDKKKAKDLESWLNWQMYSEINSYEVMDKCIFLSLLHGTAFTKVVQGVDKKVRIYNVPMENIFLPVDAKGMQVEDCDHVFEVIGLNENEVQERIESGVYEGLEDVPRGFSVRSGTTQEITTIARDVASGTKLDQMSRRDLTYIMECYLTFWWSPKTSDSKSPKQKFELIVWISPNGGKILRKVENKGKGKSVEVKRPYVEWKPYPRDDRFWGMSLPEKIRQIQEELDYAHNQNINAADVAIMPPMFYRQGSDFDPEVHKRVPAGSYPVIDPRDVVFQPVSVNPIFERQEDRYWDLAERQTGLTELFQGRQPPGKQTATLTIRRENRSEIRFKTLYQRYENYWDKQVDLIYFYDTIYFEDIKDRAIKVVGVTESFKKLSDLFPKGLEGNFNFRFSSMPISEREARKREQIQIAEFLISIPLSQEPGNLWRIAKMYAEALGEKDLEVILTKPRAANVASAEEAIQRIMSGELDFIPDPGIDSDNYIMRIQMFMRTDSYINAEDHVKGAFMILLKRSIALRQGQIRAMLDHNIIKAGAQDAGKGEAGKVGASGQNSGNSGVDVSGNGNQAFAGQ